MKADVLIVELERVVKNFIEEINKSVKLEEEMKREDVRFDIEGVNQFNLNVKNKKSNIKAIRGLHVISGENKLVEESLIIKFIK